jgi:hypothetical protein
MHYRFCKKSLPGKPGIIFTFRPKFLLNRDSCYEVALAFCKRAAISHQLVRYILIHNPTAIDGLGKLLVRDIFRSGFGTSERVR